MAYAMCTHNAGHSSALPHTRDHAQFTVLTLPYPMSQLMLHRLGLVCTLSYASMRPLPRDSTGIRRFCTSRSHAEQTKNGASNQHA